MLVIFALAFVVVATIAYQRCKHRECASLARLDGKTALVTGGTAGMGLVVAAELARRGARVVVASPFPEEARAALEEIRRTAGPSSQVIYRRLDLASLDDISRFATELRAHYPKLHLLINNAGVGGPGGRTTFDGLDYIMQVNYFGAALLTLQLLPLLRTSSTLDDHSRVVNVASGLHITGKIDIDRLTETHDSAFQAYSNSKLCLVMFTRELARRLKDRSVVVNSLEPGVVGTQIFNTWNRYIGFVLTLIARWFCKSPWQGAQTTLHVALDEDAGSVSGEYFAECCVYKTVQKVYDEKVSARLWDETLRIIKLSPEEVKSSLS